MRPQPSSTTQARLNKLERNGVIQRLKEIDGRRVDINNIRLIRLPVQDTSRKLKQAARGKDVIGD